MPIVRTSSLPPMPSTLFPIIEPSEEFDMASHNHSTVSEMSLEGVPIRELTGLAETLGIS